VREAIGAAFPLRPKQCDHLAKHTHFSPGACCTPENFLGGAAFDVTLAPSLVTEPQVDDRHLLDGVAKASDRTAEDAAGSLMAGIIAAAMV
jgi:hypothetical protein